MEILLLGSILAPCTPFLQMGTTIIETMEKIPSKLLLGFWEGVVCLSKQHSTYGGKENVWRTHLADDLVIDLNRSKSTATLGLLIDEKPYRLPPSTASVFLEKRLIMCATAEGGWTTVSRNHIEIVAEYINRSIWKAVRSKEGDQNDSRTALTMNQKRPT